MSNSTHILSVRDLRTYFHTDQGVGKAVDGVSFDLEAGKTLALVGESGCGKSVTALSVLRLVLSPPGRIEGGAVLLDGRDLMTLSPAEMRHIRGNDISMIFQEPMTSMNPVFRVGGQIAAAMRLHRDITKDEARQEAIGHLGKVGIPAPERRVDDYPHQMSGGMLQRVMIAMALSCNPKVLIADEPTTALDVTIQAQILDLLKALQRDTGMALLLITHDLGVVNEVADDVCVMYAGKIVEQGSRDQVVLGKALHPYTRGLYASLPGLNLSAKRLHTIAGTVPVATAFPSGCRFHPRCPHAMDVCAAKEPPLVAQEEGASAACWLHDVEVMAEWGLEVGIPEEVVHGG